MDYFWHCIKCFVRENISRLEDRIKQLEEQS